MKQYMQAPFEFKSIDEEAGIFEALVAVYDTVDYVNDRIVKGAFDASLEKWTKSGAPIPVVFAHDWGNLDALIGHVIEAKSTDAGLWVKAQLDIGEEFAGRVHKKMKQGILREFSIGYKPSKERQAKGGVRELVEVELFECGPCLKGVHPDTELLSVKALIADKDVLTTAYEALGALLALRGEEQRELESPPEPEVLEPDPSWTERERRIRLIEMGL